MARNLKDSYHRYLGVLTSRRQNRLVIDGPFTVVKYGGSTLATWVEQGEPQPDASIAAQPAIRRGKRARAVPVVNVRTEHRRDYYGVDDDGKRLKSGTIVTKGCKWTDSTRNSCSCPKLLIWSDRGKRRKEAAGNDEQEAYRRAREKQASFQAIAEGKPEPEKTIRVAIADAVEQFLKTKRDEGYK